MATTEERTALDEVLTVEEKAWMEHVLPRQKKFISRDSQDTRWETNEEWKERDSNLEVKPGLDMVGFENDYGKTGRRMMD